MVDSRAPDVKTLADSGTFSVPGFPDVIGTFMGRDALSLALSLIPRVRNAATLLPIFTCRDVVNKLARAGPVIYYDVRPDLAIDPAEIASKFRSTKFGVVVITNYFGFLQPHRRAIKALCEASGAWLIEDCAHSLLTEGSGVTGHFVTYSFRKILPVSDGGGLRVNVEITLPAVRYYPSAYSNALSLLISAKSMLSIHGNRFNRAAMEKYANINISDSASAETLPRLLPLSSLTQWRIGRQSFAEVIERRRRDFQFWLDVFRNCDGAMPIFEDLPPEVCPHGFPVRIENRDSFESRARQAGGGLSVHWRIDPTLGKECTTSHRLTKEVITLPIYPELTAKRREAIISLLSRRCRLAAKVSSY